MANTETINKAPPTLRFAIRDDMTSDENNFTLKANTSKVVLGPGIA